uniref:Uncharacterized protein n=1 Tax=Arundo donax TaxID=35708 RepID=A0A0A9EJW5_ARUDO
MCDFCLFTTILQDLELSWAWRWLIPAGSFL